MEITIMPGQNSWLAAFESGHLIGNLEFMAAYISNQNKYCSAKSGHIILPHRRGPEISLNSWGIHRNTTVLMRVETITPIRNAESLTFREKSAQ